MSDFESAWIDRNNKTYQLQPGSREYKKLYVCFAHGYESGTNTRPRESELEGVIAELVGFPDIDEISARIDAIRNELTEAASHESNRYKEGLMKKARSELLWCLDKMVSHAHALTRAKAVMEGK